eukprot:m.10452 g.10452  ORF g.10452 m.10452 type:complete len:75 (+) comp3673_c0_seq1:916-1140(+)
MNQPWLVAFEFWSNAFEHTKILDKRLLGIKRILNSKVPPLVYGNHMFIPMNYCSSQSSHRNHQHQSNQIQSNPT